MIKGVNSTYKTFCVGRRSKCKCNPVFPHLKSTFWPYLLIMKMLHNRFLNNIVSIFSSDVGAYLHLVRYDHK